MVQKIYKLENNTIDKYFQKSYKFLYPILSPGWSVHPIQTFAAWKDHNIAGDNRLICVFPLPNDAVYKQCERNIFNHELFEGFKELEGSYRAYLFNLNKHAEDLIHFRNGKYSLFSPDVKNKILKYYAANIYTREYFDSWFHPNKYFERYAILLNVNEWRLRNVGELCDPYNPIRETLDVKEVKSSTNVESLLLF